MQIACQIGQATGQEVPTKYAFLTVARQALVAGGYQKAKPYSVEAVLMYAFCQYGQKDPDIDAWTIIGLSARLAMRMGYHRDPRHLANISPFEGEMRRRTFYIIQNFDLSLSFQAGLPAIINEEECDTQLPLNLLDEDFDEDCKVLPPSRPETDPTPVLYYRTKSQLVIHFRRVTRHALSFKVMPYEDALRIDQQIHDFHSTLPPSLQMKSISSSFTDPTYAILNRVSLEIVYLKSLCVLHRDYLSKDRSNPAFAYSRKVCVDPSLRMLRLQAGVHLASQPGGLFHSDRWMLSSIIEHDFLLAAMVACLALHESHKSPATRSPEESSLQAETYDALKTFHEIWISRRDVSRDAQRVSNILATMLSKIPRPEAPPALTAVPRNSKPHALPTETTEELVDFPEAMDATATPSWVLSTLDNAPSSPLVEDLPTDYLPLDFNFADPLNTLTESDHLDWGFVDQYVYGRNRG